LKEKDPNANTRIYFEVRATALRPRLHTEGFPLCPHKTFYKGTSTEELQLNTGVHNSFLYTITSTQERRQKPSIKQRRNKTWWFDNHKLSLGDLKGSQTIFLTIQRS